MTVDAAVADAIPDAVVTREVAAEQAHVDRAHRRLDELAAEARDQVEEARSGDRSGALFQRFERDALEALGEERLRRLHLGEQPLCFGRIDLEDGEALHIGRLGVLEDEGSALVVDWRAPIAERFYRATVGDPLGVVRRRHISARGRRVLDLDDELLDAGAAERGVERGDLVLVGEAALLDALQRSRTGRMADIVATIQAEQDAIVRSPLAGVLVVQGGPGTGKTAIGLHRVAYLLYSHRLLLDRQGVLLVGPNPTFLRYVEHVVPSLGETGLRLATPADLVPGVRPDGPADGEEVAAVKADARMAAVLAAAVRQRQRPLRMAVEVPDGRRFLRLSPLATRRVVERVRAHGRAHNEARPLVERLVASALWGERLRRQARERAAAGAGPPPLSDDAARTPGRPPVDPAFRRQVLSEPVVRQALERMWPELSPARFLDDLLGTPALLRAAADGVLKEEATAALLDAATHRGRSPRPRWALHDVALLDEASHLLGRRRPPSRTAGAATVDRPGDELLVDTVLSADAFGNIEGGVDAELRDVLRDRLLAQARADGDAPAADGDRAEVEGVVAGHVVVDEAQDVTPMQWRALARRVSGSSLTLLGDLAQGSWPWSARSWGDVLGWLGRTPEEATVVELAIGYRTPAEVMAVAEPVLRAIDPSRSAPRAVRSVADRPRVVAGGLDRLVEVVQAERFALGTGTVAVLCPAALVAAASAALGVQPASGRSALEQAVTVLAADAAKGLEFDAVVVVEPALLRLPSLYVAITRTTRRLAVLHERPLPPALASGLGGQEPIRPFRVHA
ncbi:MAG: helicase [Acidimicrobiales bacterium]